MEEEGLGPPALEMEIRGVPLGEPSLKGSLGVCRLDRLRSLTGSSRIDWEEKGLEGWKELLEEREGALLVAIFLKQE